MPKIFSKTLTLSEHETLIAEELLKEIRQRLEFLMEVGLHYLTLDRTAPTLSGGEAQRVRLASQIGCGLVGITYILDEPSIGLHPRDNKKLIQPSSICAIWETRSSSSNMMKRRSGKLTALSILARPGHAGAKSSSMALGRSFNECKTRSLAGYLDRKTVYSHPQKKTQSPQRESTNYRGNPSQPKKYQCQNPLRRIHRCHGGFRLGKIFS